MEPLKPKGILRGAPVEGVSFCLSREEIPAGDGKPSEKPSTKGKPKDFDILLKQAEKQPISKGLQAGHQHGFEAGKSEGVAAGMKLGLESARSEFKESLTVLNAIAYGFSIKQLSLYESSKPEIIKFCLAICEQVLKKHLASPEHFAEQIEHLLIHAKNILKDVSVDVLVAPEDYAMMEKHWDWIDYDAENLHRLNFIADKSIPRGNCRLETSSISISKDC